MITPEAIAHRAGLLAQENEMNHTPEEIELVANALFGSAYRGNQDAWEGWADEATALLDALAALQPTPALSGPVWCDGCRATGAIHCAHPDQCGHMLSTEAASDNWKAWIDDLPLPDDFRPGINRLQDFISAIVCYATVPQPNNPTPALDALAMQRAAAQICYDEAWPEDGTYPPEDWRIQEAERSTVEVCQTAILALPTGYTEAQLDAEAMALPKVRALVEAIEMARNRLEQIADEAWNGDARDFKRRIPGIFNEWDTALLDLKGAEHE